MPVVPKGVHRITPETIFFGSTCDDRTTSRVNFTWKIIFYAIRMSFTVTEYILADAGETQVFDAQGWICVRRRFKVQRSEFNDSRNKNLHLERIRWHLFAYSTNKPQHH